MKQLSRKIKEKMSELYNTLKGSTPDSEQYARHIIDILILQIEDPEKLREVLDMTRILLAEHAHAMSESYEISRQESVRKRDSWNGVFMSFKSVEL